MINFPACTQGKTIRGEEGEYAAAKVCSRASQAGSPPARQPASQTALFSSPIVEEEECVHHTWTFVRVLPYQPLPPPIAPTLHAQAQLSICALARCQIPVAPRACERVACAGMPPDTACDWQSSPKQPPSPFTFSFQCRFLTRARCQNQAPSLYTSPQHDPSPPYQCSPIALTDRDCRTPPPMTSLSSPLIATTARGGLKL